MTVRVTPLMDDNVVAACIRKWDLRSLDDTIVMVRRLTSVAAFDDVVVVAPDHPGYTADLMEMNRRDPSTRSSWDRIVERTGTAAAGLWVPGRAVGFTAVRDGISSVFSVAVREEDRRTGLASRIMAASVVWALERGAEWQFIQVLGTNEAAIELYEGLGFNERYQYRYLQPMGER